MQRPAAWKRHVGHRVAANMTNHVLVCARRHRFAIHAQAIQPVQVKRVRLLEQYLFDAEKAVPDAGEIVFDIEENHLSGPVRDCGSLYPTTGFCSLILIVVPLVESFSSISCTSPSRNPCLVSSRSAASFDTALLINSSPSRWSISC